MASTSPKNRLIISNPTDADSGSKRPNRHTYIFKKSRSAVFSLISFMVMAGMFLPVSAQAGALSFLTTILSGSEFGYGGGMVQNVQKMTLPRAAMNVDPNPSKGGGDITIVGGSALLSQEGPSGTTANIKEFSNTSGTISVYVVREGDTLSEIADMFDVTVNTIVWANDLDTATIRPGQTLAILPVAGIKYTVKNGGTLRDIIDKHGGNLEEAELYNGIGADEHLEAGTVVIVPEGEYSLPTLARRAHTSRHLSSPLPSFAGFYMNPVRGGMKTQGLHGYNAIDIGAPYGTPIVAAADGQVIIVRSSGWNGGYGKYVVIRHDNGTQTLYAHNSSNIAVSGQWVVRGQVIGYMGSTGRSTGSHVHFEVRGAANPF